MPDRYPDPRTEDIMAGDRRISRPDASLPDWEVPDTAYRPIPIVWFTAAMVMHMFLLAIFFFTLVDATGYITAALSIFATASIGLWTWKRGMHSAGLGWKAATIIVMGAQLAFVLIALAGRSS